MGMCVSAVWFCRHCFIKAKEGLREKGSENFQLNRSVSVELQQPLQMAQLFCQSCDGAKKKKSCSYYVNNLDIY